MIRISKVSLILLVVLTLTFSSLGFDVQAQNSDWDALLSTVSDASTRTTLSNSIAIGLIKTPSEFSDALHNAEIRKPKYNKHNSHKNSNNYQNQNNGDLYSRITKLAAGLAGKDSDAVTAVSIQSKSRLFNQLNVRVPHSYQAAIDLAVKCNPRVGTSELPRLEREIDDYLDSIANDPAILYALKVTNTDMKSLKKNWFGPGAGFEHVICGEVKGSKVSGYHWWYKFYVDECANRAKFGQQMSSSADKKIFTGSFSWDPDGKGPLPASKKPKGGFTIGNSAQALLALGHIAIETARHGNNVPSSIKFEANINGNSYSWQLYTFQGTIRSLYPFSSAKASRYREVEVQREFYDLEEDAIRGMFGETSLTVH